MKWKKKYFIGKRGLLGVKNFGAYSVVITECGMDSNLMVFIGQDLLDF